MSSVIGESEIIDVALLQALVENSTAALIAADLEGRCIFASPACEEVTGYLPHELIGQVMHDLVHHSYPDGRPYPGHECNLYKAMSQIQPLRNVEEVFFRKGGAPFFALCSSNPVLENGVCKGAVVEIKDISEHKLTEIALREGEARFRAMSDSAPLFVWMSGPDGKVNYINKTWMDFLNLPAEDVIAYGMRDAVYPADVDRHIREYREAYANQAEFSIECRMMRADGEYRWLLNKGAPIFMPDGGLAGYIGTSVDITDRKIAEDQLKIALEREQLIRRVVEVIGQSFDIDRILQTVAQELGQYLQVDRCSVSRFSSKGGKLLFNMSAQYCAEGCRPVDLEDIERITNAVQHLSPEVMAENQEQIVNISDQAQYIEHLRQRMALLPVALPGLSTEQLVDIVLKYDVQSSLRLNIFYRGVLYGGISINQCSHNRIWTQDEIDLVKTIADYAGSAIYQAELYQEADETAERLRRVFTGTNDGFWDWDLRNNTTYWSERFYEILGIPKGIPPSVEYGWELIHPEDRDTVQNAVQEHFQNRQKYEMQFRMRHSSGEYRWILTKAEASWDEAGKPIRMSGSYSDITDRVITDQALSKSLEKERLLRRLMEIVSKSFDLDSVLEEIVKEVGLHFKTDRCGLLRYTVGDNELQVKLSKQYSPNQPALRDEEIPFKSLAFLKGSVLKCLEPDVINISCMDELARESREYFGKYDMDAEQYISEMEALFNKYSVKSNLSVEIYYQGIPYGMIGLHQCEYTRTWTEEEVGLLRDIATHVGVAFSQAELFHDEQRAKAELEKYSRKLEASNRELEQFATIASHDLQEPLRKVRMFSQMLSSSGGPEEQDYIDRMQSAVTRMQDQISSLLELSRVTRKGQPFQKTDLSLCVQNALSDLEVAIKELNPEIVLEPLEKIDADPKQIEQLFLNLIGNSLKFQKSDTRPVIRISGKRLDGQYQIIVQDNGIGFNEDQGERIFEAFERLHGRTEYPGTGMGLTICRKIVERHAGTIKAQSAQGEGAVFIMTLPLVQSEASES